MPKKEEKRKIALDIFQKICPTWTGYKMIYRYSPSYGKYKEIVIKADEIFKLILKKIK